MRAAVRRRAVAVEADDALVALRVADAPGVAPQVRAARLHFALTQVSRHIDQLAGEQGLEEPSVWQLLGVRDDIDSHLLAATVLSDSQGATEQVLAILDVGAERARERLEGLRSGHD